MREAGRLVATTLSAVCAAALPGVRLRDLDDLAMTTIHEAGPASSFLGHAPSWAPTPFNGVLCLSPNEAVVHGRPTGRRLQDGDLLSVDCGAILDGWNGDAAVTIPVGAVGTARGEDVRLVAATQEALAAGIAVAVPALPWPTSLWLSTRSPAGTVTPTCPTTAVAASERRCTSGRSCPISPRPATTRRACRQATPSRSNRCSCSAAEAVAHHQGRVDHRDDRPAPRRPCRAHHPQPRQRTARPGAVLSCFGRPRLACWLGVLS